MGAEHQQPPLPHRQPHNTGTLPDQRRAANSRPHGEQRPQQLRRNVVGVVAALRQPLQDRLLDRRLSQNGQ